MLTIKMMPKRFVEAEYRKADHPYAFYLLNQGLTSAEIKANAMKQRILKGFAAWS